MTSDPPPIDDVGAAAPPAPTQAPAPMPAPVSAAPAVMPPPAPAVAPPPSIADGIEHHADPRSIKHARLVGLITALTMSGATLIAAGILGLTGVAGWIKVVAIVAWLALSATLVVFAFRWPAIHHRHLFYRVDENGLRIRRGVWWRAVIDVPRSRVQHTDVSQGPIERSFGLATLVVFTAGTEHAQVGLPGLDHETALRIRDHLIEGQGVDAV